ncbi:subtilisin-like protein [Terfezia boudieri ATCC MYA-4762]|uniref:Subtilisin-like protein n=1 Tax=Terfezia boudieri ATCC MYA-4762 TaxID=1051890 RepID=A0A3N4MCJ8_9PEZI|nr:subtilisin-like protein [Terfezia boudieri ATCC MYA-4762]
MYKWGRFLCSAKFQSTRPITVAILDDGFDLTRPSIKENFKGTPGVSFQPSGVKHYKSGVAVGYKSHGTIMAYCVKQMFPQVRILPIRIKTGDRRNTASQSFSPFDVIEALEFIAKLEYHVDIVNMSWTIEFPPSFNPQYSSARGDNDETYKLYSKLQNAMNALIMKKIILLCATSDKGRNAASRNVPVYPGAFGFHNPDILTIGSASSDGDRSKPAYTPVHFIFPGERVTLEPDLGEASGSSVATAIASGMAASILFLVDLVERERDRFDGEVVQRDKVTTSMIRDAFTALDGSPTQTLEVLQFRRELGEMCKINGFEADGDRLSRRWLAMSKRLLRILGLATY